MALWVWGVRGAKGGVAGPAGAEGWSLEEGESLGRQVAPGVSIQECLSSPHPALVLGPVLLSVSTSACVGMYTCSLSHARAPIQVPLNVPAGVCADLGSLLCVRRVCAHGSLVCVCTPGSPWCLLRCLLPQAVWNYFPGLQLRSLFPEHRVGREAIRETSVCGPTVVGRPLCISP